MVNEKFKHFVLRRNCITDKCDAANILHKIYDTESNIYRMRINSICLR